MNNAKSTYLNHLRAGKRRIKHYLRKNGVAVNGHGIKDKYLIRKFAEMYGIEITGNLNEFVVNVYLSGDGIFERLNSSFYLTPEWKRVRRMVLKNYGGVCMKCGSSDRIAVDHILPRSLYPELELSYDNLQVLCLTCNSQKSNEIS